MESSDSKVPGGDSAPSTTNIPPAAPPPYPGNVEPPKPTAQYSGTTPNVTVVTGGAVAAVITPGPPVGPRPMTITCKSCNQLILTRVDKTTSGRSHVAALLLCIFGFVLCAWIPYVMDSCKNTEHFCPNCGAYIGTYR